MKCPSCGNVNLTMSERQGIEIDYCPECRGVWLDRGELDKIIERSTTSSAGYAAQPSRPAARPHDSDPPHYDDSYKSGSHYKKKKREGFLSDLFDF